MTEHPPPRSVGGPRPTPAYPPDDLPPSGFHSDSARSRTRGVVWPLGILVGLVQMAVPIVSVIWIVFVMLKAIFAGNSPEVDRAAWYEGSVWIPRQFSEEGAGGGEKQKGWRLLRIKGSKQKTVALPHVPHSESTPWLMTGGKELWVVSAKQLARIKGGAVVPGQQVERPDAASRPFSLAGVPAVLGREDRRLRALRLEGGAWKEAGSIGLDLPESEYPDDMVVVAGADGLHVFLETTDDDVMYARGKLGGSTAGGFRKISTTDGGFAAGRTGGKLWLARVVDEEDWDRLEVLERSGDEWKVAATLKGLSLRDLHWIERDGHAIIVAESLLNGVRLIRFDGRDLEVISSTGHGFALILAWVLLPQLGALGLTILFALVVGFVLLRTRVAEYRSDQGGEAEIGSLLRRTAARLVDTVIILLPLLVGLTWALTTGGMDRLIAATGTGAQVALGAWGLLLFGVMCAMEGHNGATPGKVITGIRVLGEDLQPCGFGRALVRNMFLGIDGMMMYVLGVMSIALSSKQQRLGDMVAKTVVVRSSNNPGAM